MTLKTKKAFLLVSLSKLLRCCVFAEKIKLKKGFANIPCLKKHVLLKAEFINLEHVDTIMGNRLTQ